MKAIIVVRKGFDGEIAVSHAKPLKRISKVTRTAGSEKNMDLALDGHCLSHIGPFLIFSGNRLDGKARHTRGEQRH